MAKTVLRVKRRRDAAAPSTLELCVQTAPHKRLRSNDDEGTKQLTSMMTRSTLLNRSSTRKEETIPDGNKKPIVFRRMKTQNEQPLKRKGGYEEQVKVVDARLDLNEICNDSERIQNEAIGFADGNCDKSKRPRLCLQMVESRIMLEKEFWQQLITNESHNEQQKKKYVEDKSPSSQAARRSALRARMKRTASSSITGTKINRASSTIILDPLMRRVNESLISIHTNSSSHDPTNAIKQHIDLLRTHSMKDNSKIVNWQCTDGSGTILHLCAMFHSIEGSQAVCYLFSRLLDFTIRDSCGRTAIDVARSVGCQGVAEILMRFGDEGKTIETVNEDDDDFVYDVYCVETLKHENDVSPKGTDDGVCMQDSKSKDTNILDASSQSMSNEYSHDRPVLNHGMNDVDTVPVLVDIQGGVGYWEGSELILDVLDDIMDDSDVDGDEYDSNREDCDANDYPDFDSDDDFQKAPRYSNGFFDEPYLHSDDESNDGVDFRNRPVDWNTMNGIDFRTAAGDFDDDGEYHGYIKFTGDKIATNKRGSLDTVAYDFELDHDNSD